MRCDSIGQYVVWGPSSEYKVTCKKEHIFNETTRNRVIGTINNVKSYLERVLSVDPLEQTIKARNLTGYYSIPPTTYENVNLVFHIVARPFNDKFYAVTQVTQYLDTSKRPLEAVICINPSLAPDEVQNDTARSSNFFYAMLHECIHGLGFLNSFYKYYHPADSYTPYHPNACRFTKLRIQRVFLITPHAHAYGVRHYGYENITDDNGNTCPAGIELENGGESTQVYSHLEQRVFYSDLMTSVLVQSSSEPFLRFTDATMAILLDTGNYDVDYHYLRPTIFGNPEAFPKDSKDLVSFSYGPPHLSFPSQYVIYDPADTKDLCSFDYKSWGNNATNYIPVPPCNSSTTYCKNRMFYNPLGYGYVGDSNIFDFQIYKYSHTCEKGFATIPGNLKCLRYKLTENNVTFKLPLDVRYPQQFAVCNEKNDTKTWVNYSYFDKHGYKNYGYYKCPDFERFKRSIKLFNSYFDSDPFDLNSSVSYKTESDEIDDGAFDMKEENKTEIIRPTPLIAQHTPATKDDSSGDSVNPNFSYMGTHLTKATFWGVLASVGAVVVVCGTLIYLAGKVFKTPIESIDEKDNKMELEHKKKRKRRTHKKQQKTEEEMKLKSMNQDEEVKHQHKHKRRKQKE